MSIELTGVGVGARSAWRRALGRDPTALISQTPEWMDCLTASGRYEDATRAYATADGEELILPLARRRWSGPAGVLTSMPFGWGTGGLVATSDQARAEEIAAIVTDLRSQPALLVGVRPAPGTAAAWRAGVPAGVETTEHMCQTVDLSGGFEMVWKNRFSSTVRSHCRKAERRGVSVERDDTGRLMAVFDTLYRRSVDRWARQQHEPLWLARWRAARRDPAEKFQTVADRLGPACRVWVASRAGEAVAAMIVLVNGHHSTMWRAAMNKEAVRGTGASELIHSLAFEEACNAGHRFFHLGDSAPTSALARNKRGFGAADLQYTGYRFERVPLTAADRFARRQIKRVIGFRD
jgi:hypothetical protein